MVRSVRERPNESVLSDAAVVSFPGQRANGLSRTDRAMTVAMSTANPDAA